jgi:hypothetical protein
MRGSVAGETLVRDTHQPIPRAVAYSTFSATSSPVCISGT